MIGNCRSLRAYRPAAPQQGQNDTIALLVPMTPPSTIAHYKLTAKLGKGMGAVYRATDTKLNRDVAIKVLPPAFAEDAARMQRFEREAQMLASSPMERKPTSHQVGQEL